MTTYLALDLKYPGDGHRICTGFYVLHPQVSIQDSVFLPAAAPLARRSKLTTAWRPPMENFESLLGHFSLDAFLANHINGNQFAGECE